MRGKKLKNQFLRADQLETYNGRLKMVSEKDIRRLIVKLLILKVMKERFITNKVRDAPNVLVYLSLGKHA